MHQKGIDTRTHAHPFQDRWLDHCVFTTRKSDSISVIVNTFDIYWMYIQYFGIDTKHVCWS